MHMKSLSPILLCFVCNHTLFFFFIHRIGIIVISPLALGSTGQNALQLLEYCVSCFLFNAADEIIYGS